MDDNDDLPDWDDLTPEEKAHFERLNALWMKPTSAPIRCPLRSCWPTSRSGGQS